jgi:hypothetical protein
MNNGGDVLARGARKANFPAAGGKVTQEKWDAIWAEDKEVTGAEQSSQLGQVLAETLGDETIRASKRKKKNK